MREKSEMSDVYLMHRLRGGKLACLVVYCGLYHRTIELLWVRVFGPRVPVRSPVVLVCGLISFIHSSPNKPVYHCLAHDPSFMLET